jgi:hypothetical protein
VPILLSKILTPPAISRSTAFLSVAGTSFSFFFSFFSFFLSWLISGAAIAFPSSPLSFFFLSDLEGFELSSSTSASRARFGALDGSSSTSSKRL